jgi:cytoskeleton protein RodZ
MSIGKILREKREERKLSIAEVFAETKINKKYLQALEDDNFLLIPSQVYAKGFLKAYSEYLGLDTKTLVGELMGYYKNREGDRKAVLSAKKMTRVIPMPTVPKLPNITWIPNFNMKIKFKFDVKMLYIAAVPVLAALLVCSIIYGYMLFNALRPRSVASIMANPPATAKIKPLKAEPKKAPAKVVKAPAVKAPAAKTSTAKAPALTEAPSTIENPILNGKIELRIETIGRSWIYVISGEKVLYSETLNAGAKLRFVGREITVKTGNGGGVKVYVNGVSQGLMGESGVAAEKTYRASE